MSFQSSINYRDLSGFGATITTSGTVSEEMLHAAGVSSYGAVICLLPHNHPKRATGAGAILRSQQIEYFHLAVDWLAPTQADIDQFVQALEHLMKRGLKVHVYFALNMRVSAFCAVYLFERGLMTHDQAQTLLEQVWVSRLIQPGASFWRIGRWVCKGAQDKLEPKSAAPLGACS